MDDPALERRVGRAFEHFGFELPLEAIVAPASSPSRTRLRIATAIAVPLVVVLAIGVLLGRQLSTPTSVFGSWQAVPSIADPKLAAAARGVCLHEGDGGASLLIQDQRGLAAGPTERWRTPRVRAPISRQRPQPLASTPWAVPRASQPQTRARRGSSAINRRIQWLSPWCSRTARRSRPQAVVDGFSPGGRPIRPSRR